MRTRWLVSCLLPLAALACGDDATAPQDPGPPDAQPPAVPAEATAWLETAVVPFDGSHLSLPHDDLDFLRDLVGGARIVALGENTHGTRDFFEMKARILRYLVEEMGFDAFAIEATMPEAFRLDRYVRTGVGDPAVNLAGLYFWTWNTESVLEMIEWMRDHNAAGGDVGFYGFDMQFPGMGLHNTLQYVAEVDPDALADAQARLECMTTYANGPDGRSPTPGYRDQTADYRSACRGSLEAMGQALEENREVYEAASGADAFARAQQSLRVAIQFDLMVSGEQSRDESMAENTEWIADYLGPESRIVLWAHNFHVSTVPGAQGSYLRPVFRDDMVIMGFSHEGGSFTAIRQSGSSYLGLSTFRLDPTLPLSYEDYFSSVTEPRFFLDLRAVDTSASGASWLSGSRRWRAIGCCYDPSNPSRYWSDQSLTSSFDVIIHFESTRPTVILPGQPPSVF